jgi:hypothetical protein
MLPLNLNDPKGNESPSKEKVDMRTAWQDHIPLTLHKYSEVSHEHPTVNSVWGPGFRGRTSQKVL